MAASSEPSLPGKSPSGDGSAAVAETPSFAIRSQKVAHVVASTIVEDIVSQGLQPGDRLPSEAAMLQRFRASRASIREGLRLLEMYGAISIRPGQGGGPVVEALDARDLGRTLSLFFRLSGATYRDLLKARLVVEPVMARLAAEQQDTAHFARLREVVARENASPLDEYLPRANEFHHTVSGASGNPVLNILGQALRTLYAGNLTGRGLFPPEARMGVRETHQEIANAILDGDGALAEQRMKEHMQELAELQEERTPWFIDERVSWEA